MDVSSIQSSQSSQPVSSQNVAGVQAPQTEAQRADLQATRVTDSKESANVEDNARNAEGRKFEAVKRAAQFVAGENPFLNNISFTIYNNQSGSNVGQNEIRFTNLATGKIEVKSEVELLSSGDIVSGSV